MERGELSTSAGQAVAHRLGISSFETPVKDNEQYNVEVEAVCSRCANLFNNCEDSDNDANLLLPLPTPDSTPFQHQRSVTGRTSFITCSGSINHNHSKSAWWKRWRWRRRGRRWGRRRSCLRTRTSKPFTFQCTTVFSLVFLAVVYFLFIVQLLPLPVFATATATTTQPAGSAFYANSGAGATFTLSSSSSPSPINSSMQPESETTSEVHFRESGEPCMLDIECSGNLICAKPPRAKYSYCDCDSRNYTWSSKLQKCVGLVGSACTDSVTSNKLACVDNAYCDIKPQLGYGVCECTGSYSSTKARTCQLRYGFPCVNQNYDNLCNKDQLLNCIEDVCRCMFPNQMKYDKEHGQCRMLVGNSCDPKSEMPEILLEGDVTVTGKRKTHIGCVTGAKCVARDAAGEFGDCHRIEPPTTTKVPRTWFSYEDRKPPRRKNPDSTTKEGKSLRPRQYINQHHQRTPTRKRTESIKNSLIDYDEQEHKNQEIPIPRAKATSSAPTDFVSFQSSLCSYLTYFLLLAFALAGILT